jgi:hypothetical protein
MKHSEYHLCGDALVFVAGYEGGSRRLLLFFSQAKLCATNST